MMTRKELENMGIVMTDEEWKQYRQQMSDIEDFMQEEDHPVDD